MPSTVSYHHRVLHEALAYAVDWGFISQNPADRVKPGKRKQQLNAPAQVAASRVRTLRDDQVNVLLEAVKGTYLYMPVFLALTTGARLGEILAGTTWILKGRSHLYHPGFAAAEKGQL
ncbi:MAG: hypothetical protein PWP65_890 [Clostridia bacterium]|nr:hypothetical protein [Clostridia bacterium]